MIGLVWFNAGGDCRSCSLLMLAIGFLDNLMSNYNPGPIFYQTVKNPQRLPKTFGNFAKSGHTVGKHSMH